VVFYRQIDRTAPDTPYRDFDVGLFYHDVDEYGRVTYLTLEMFEQEIGRPFEDFTRQIVELPINHETERFIPSCFSWDSTREMFNVGDFHEQSEQVPEPPPSNRRLSRDPADREEQLRDILLHAAARRGAQELVVRYEREEPIIVVDQHDHTLLGDDSKRIVYRKLGYRQVGWAILAGCIKGSRITNVVRLEIEPDEARTQSQGWPCLMLWGRLLASGLLDGEQPLCGHFIDRPWVKESPVLIRRTGFFDLGGNASGPLKSSWTNIYGRSIKVGEKICLWKKDFRESMGYRVTRSEVFKAPAVPNTMTTPQTGDNG
jgi:hypothetical protein